MSNHFFLYLTEHLKKKNFQYILQKTNERKKDYANEFEFWNLRAIAFAQLQEPKEAIYNFEKAFNINQNNPVPLFNIAKLFYDYNKFQQSYEYYLKSFNLDNAYSAALLGLINSLLKLGRYEESMSFIRLGIENHNLLKKELLYNLLGVAYEYTGNLEEAYKYYKKSLIEKKDFYPSLINEANYFASKGINETALNKYLEILKKYPDSSEVHRRVSLLKKYKNHDDAHLIEMNKLFEKYIGNEKIIEELGFALSKAYEDLKDYDNSYKFFTISNQIRDKKVIYNKKFEEDQFSLIKKFFDIKNNLPLKISKNENNFQPIFILGMPRSGSTLIEQIISAHSEVEGLGEIDYFHKSLVSEIDIKKDLNRNDNLNFDENISKKVASLYKKFVTKNKRTDKLFFTDKLPLNFKYVGFILKCFPKSIIIHTERNSKDIFVSILKNYFGQLQMNYAYNEENIAHYIHCYKNYMKYWKNLFDKKIYDLNYDLLVNNFEDEVTKLLNHCHLKFESNCLNYDKNKRSVVTASINQVRQPIYSSSSKSFQNYEKFLNNYFNDL